MRKACLSTRSWASLRQVLVPWGHLQIQTFPWHPLLCWPPSVSLPLESSFWWDSCLWPLFLSLSLLLALFLETLSCHHFKDVSFPSCPVSAPGACSVSLAHWLLPELTMGFYQIHGLLSLVFSNVFPFSSSEVALRPCHFIFTAAWPQYKSDNRSWWPENGTLDFQILTDDDNVSHHTDKWSKISLISRFSLFSVLMLFLSLLCPLIFIPPTNHSIWSYGDSNVFWVWIVLK